VQEERWTEVRQGYPPFQRHALDSLPALPARLPARMTKRLPGVKRQRLSRVHAGRGSSSPRSSGCCSSSPSGVGRLSAKHTKTKKPVSVAADRLNKLKLK
jgi:hypothetical protein